MNDKECKEGFCPSLLTITKCSLADKPISALKQCPKLEKWYKKSIEKVEKFHRIRYNTKSMYQCKCGKIMEQSGKIIFCRSCNNEVVIT